jgi:hypothetical protein
VVGGGWLSRLDGWRSEVRRRRRGRTEADALAMPACDVGTRGRHRCDAGRAMARVGARGRRRGGGVRAARARARARGGGGRARSTWNERPVTGSRPVRANGGAEGPGATWATRVPEASAGVTGGEGVVRRHNPARRQSAACAVDARAVSGVMREVGVRTARPQKRRGGRSPVPRGTRDRPPGAVRPRVPRGTRGRVRAPARRAAGGPGAARGRCRGVRDGCARGASGAGAWRSLRCGVANRWEPCGDRRPGSVGAAARCRRRGLGAARGRWWRASVRRVGPSAASRARRCARGSRRARPVRVARVGCEGTGPFHVERPGSGAGIRRRPACASGRWRAPLGRAVRPSGVGRVVHAPGATACAGGAS